MLKHVRVVCTLRHKLVLTNYQYEVAKHLKHRLILCQVWTSLCFCFCLCPSVNHILHVLNVVLQCAIFLVNCWIILQLSVTRVVKIQILSMPLVSKSLRKVTGKVVYCTMVLQVLESNAVKSTGFSSTSCISTWKKKQHNFTITCY